MNPISDVPRNERVLGTKCVLKAVADGRINARLATPGRMQRHDTDRPIVAAKDKFGRSQNNGVLDQGEKSTQHYGKQLGNLSMYS